MVMKTSGYPPTPLDHTLDLNRYVSVPSLALCVSRGHAWPIVFVSVLSVQKQQIRGSSKFNSFGDSFWIPGLWLRLDIPRAIFQYTLPVLHFANDERVAATLTGLLGDVALGIIHGVLPKAFQGFFSKPACLCGVSL